MTALATLSSKFQISIPKEVRDAQHWQAGQEFVFIPKGKGVYARARVESTGWNGEGRRHE